MFTRGPIISWYHSAIGHEAKAAHPIFANLNMNLQEGPKKVVFTSAGVVFHKALRLDPSLMIFVNILRSNDDVWRNKREEMDSKTRDFEEAENVVFYSFFFARDVEKWRWLNLSRKWQLCPKPKITGHIFFWAGRAASFVAIFFSPTPPLINASPTSNDDRNRRLDWHQSKQFLTCKMRFVNSGIQRVEFEVFEMIPFKRRYSSLISRNDRVIIRCPKSDYLTERRFTKPEKLCL